MPIVLVKSTIKVVSMLRLAVLHLEPRQLGAYRETMFERVITSC